MIQSYSCRDTEKLANHVRVQRFHTFERVAQRKLALLNAAASLEFLRIPLGKCKGSNSIRIDNQWRICFRYRDGDAFNAEIVDYHKRQDWGTT